MKKLLWFYLFLLCSWSVSAQEIKGTVTDEEGLPVPGATVTVLSTNVSTSTDFDGNFTVAAAAGERLRISMVSFADAVIAASADMRVVMKGEQLDEVVVIGYGTKKKGSITGSVSQVKSEDIMRTPAQSAIQSIQGKAAGINIVTNDEPGSNPSIRIRGLGTFIGGRDPLYIVDGVEARSLNNLAPNEIATFDILKDASSIAIYGQKGRNGVIIVTTKKGKSGAIRVNYDSYFGIRTVQKKVEMADSYRFAYYNNTSMGSSSYFNFEQPYNTDWFDEITTTGQMMSNHVSISGGNDNATYYLAATNYKETGILQGTEFERTNVNSRNEFKLFNDRVKISQNLNLGISNSTPKPVSAFTNAYKQSPIVPVRFDNGRWGVPLRNPATGLIDINGSDRFNNVGNPVAQLALANARNKNVLISGSVAAEVKIIKELKFTSNFGATYGTNKGYNFVDNAANYLAQNATASIDDYRDSFGVNEVINNTLTQYRNDDYEFNWDNYFSYSKTFSRHTVNATVGMSRSTRNNGEFISGTRFNVPESSNYWYLNLSNYNTEVAPGSVVNNSHSTPVVALAYFARADYDFAGRYLVTASVRREGVSSFLSEKRWAYFPGVSAGWVISNESFFSGVKFFNSLKIRGGYGEVGNGDSQNSLNVPIYRAGSNYAFGDTQNINPGSYQPYATDPNLTWETMSEVDFGIDFAILDNRLSGTLDFYSRKSSDIIVPISLPRVLSEERVIVNAGDISNKGVEALLRWTDNIGINWKYWVSANYSYNKNKLDAVSNNFFSDYIGGDLGNGQFTKQILVGEALGSFYVYQTTGFDGDGRFTYSDERVVAGSYIPTYTYALNFGFNYKNFDFSVDTYGVGGNKVYNGKKAQRFGGENIEMAYLDSFWTPGNPTGANPTPFNEVPRPSTYYVEDGSYFRINNITLGYTLPKFFDPISKARIYATAINPFIFTKYTGYSPEVVGSDNANPLGNAGIELDAYPTNKSFLFGLNVSF